MVWWLDGTLHLDHGTAEVADVAQLADAGFGVVVRRRRRQPSSGSPRTAPANARHDGPRHAAGRPAPVGKVAWLEPDGGDLVVYDVVTKDAVAPRPDGRPTRS